MFFALAALAATAATVGSTAGAAVEQKKQADKAIDDQKQYTLATATVEYGQAMNTAPGAVPTA
jgi:hypothetical protein